MQYNDENLTEFTIKKLEIFSRCNKKIKFYPATKKYMIKYY